MSDAELPFNVTDMQTEPTATPIVVECETCHEVLLNQVTRWTHRRLGHHYDHAPIPVPRTETTP